MGKSEDEIRMLALGRTLVDSGIEVGLGATPVAGKMLSGFVSGIAQKTGGQVTKELARGALDGLAERTVNHLVQKYGHETLIRASKELLEGTGGEMLEEIGNTANGYLWRAIAGDTQDAPDLHDYAEAAAGGFWGGLPFGGAAALGTGPGGSDAPDGRRKAPMSKHPPGMSGKKRPPRRKRAKTPQRKGRRRCRTSPPAGRPE